MRGEGLQWVKERALGGINSNCYPERRSKFHAILREEAWPGVQKEICKLFSEGEKNLFWSAKKKFAEGILRLQHEEVTDPRHLYRIQRSNVLKQQGEP